MYELRELKASDMGAVCKIISSIGLKEFKDVDIPVGEGASSQEIGMAIAFGIGGTVMENLPKAQRDIDKFLASVTGMKVEEIQDMSFADYGDLIIQVISKKEFQDFFSHVMKLFNH